MAVVRVQLGLANYAGQPFFVIHEWVVDVTEMAWEATTPGLNGPMERMADTGIYHNLMVRVQPILPVPQDDTDLEFHETREKEERNRLFRRINAATDSDLGALAYWLAFHWENVRLLHEAFDKLGIAHE